MQFPVLIEPVASNGFRAQGGEPFPFVAEGATREEALRHLQELIESRLQTGAEFVQSEIAAPGHALAPFAGMFQDDPEFDEWRRAIDEYRQQREEEPSLP